MSGFIDELGTTLLLLALLIAAIGSLLTVVLWPLGDDHDPYAEPIGDHPFSPSAGVALRPDAGGCNSHALGDVAARSRSAA